MPFLIIFIVIPLAELFVFGLVGGRIGLFNALLVALITAVIGGAVVRHQGLQTIKNVQMAVNKGKLPLGELFDGICLIIAGATLITPGFITDTIGFLLLIPAFRKALQHVIKTHTTWMAETHTNNFQSHGYYEPPPQDRDDHIIEVEYEDLDKKD